jgi:hypothetical protein
MQRHPLQRLPIGTGYTLSDNKHRFQQSPPLEMRRTVGEIMTKLLLAAKAATEGPSYAAINALLHHNRTTAARHDLSCPAKSLHWRNRSVSVELFRNRCIQPLQVPTVFLLEQINQGADLPALMDPHHPASLMAEYLDAQGYHFPWGYVVEAAVEEGSTIAEAGCLYWRIVPVQMWGDRLGDRDMPSIAERLNGLTEDVNLHLIRCMPHYIQLAPRRPHDLFAFTCDPADRDRARRWMADKLLPKILPRLLEDVACRTCLTRPWAMPSPTVLAH